MKIITTANAADYLAWYAKALRDDTVWPFISLTPRYDAIKIEDDDWERRVIMDDAATGVCVLRLNRNGDRSVYLSLWALSGAARAAVVGALLRDAIMVGSRYGVEWIDSCCHESNEPSRRVHDKFFGTPWGIEPAGAWNGKLREYENRHCYRAAASSLELRINNSQEAVAA